VINVKKPALLKNILASPEHPIYLFFILKDSNTTPTEEKLMALSTFLLKTLILKSKPKNIF
jgi:hypothetical protein